MQPSVDREFKMFLKHRGIEIDSGMFQLQFNEPQNFGKYRQIELDTQLVNIFNQIQQLPYVSKRFAMKRYLKLTEEEIYENQRMWSEENAESIPGAMSDAEADGLGSVGASPMPTAPAGDEGGLEDDNLAGSDSPISGAENQTDTTAEN